MNFPLSRLSRLVLIATVAALLAACTFNRFAYNQADTLAAWMVDDYFDLTPAQKDEFHKRFDRFYAWHRHEQLPEYAQFMRTARARMQAGLTREDVQWFMDGARARMRAAARQGGPDAAALLATLTPAQIDNLRKKWEKDNRKYVKEHKLNGTLAERQEADAKRTIKFLREWLMPLNAEQEVRVQAMVRELPRADRERYEERLRRQKEFLELLADRNGDPKRFAERVTTWLAHWERGRTPEVQRQLDLVWQKRADMYVAIHRMLTPEQRLASLQRIDNYTADFLHLAGVRQDHRTAAR